MTSFPAGNLALVTPDATIVASVKIGAPARSAARAAPTSAGWMARSRVRSVCPLACTIRTATFSASARQVRQVGLGADHRERLAIDLRAVRAVLIPSGRPGDHRRPHTAAGASATGTGIESAVTGNLHAVGQLSTST